MRPLRRITVDAPHTAGLTTKEVIVGVLTGKIGRSQPRNGLNTAMAANPIGVVVAAVVAFVGVFAVLRGRCLPARKKIGSSTRR